MATEYVAIVGKIIVDGKHGPYGVAHHRELGAVTFSLSNSVWIEEKWPDPGTVVMLLDLRMKRGGWRAEKARLFRPEDQTSNQQQQSKGANQDGQ